MMENQTTRERLYLLRDDTSEIYVNNCQLLQQHQIDGLRFLFRQFHKNKPVAVVNFPEQCGKSVAVALFINAIKSLLNKPVLIICYNEHEIEIWKQIILKWTDYNIDDIAIEATNVYLKKKIFLKSSVELTSYQRPNWSIVVVKNEISKPLFKLTFNADLKIWLTSIDLKKDLIMLAYTYNWLLPLSGSKLTMNAQEFIPSGHSVREKVEKAILLDSFIEEFIIQQNKMKPFTGKQDNNKEISELSRNIEKIPHKSRKNKDATGNKIKRSRRIIEDDDIVTTEVGMQNNANKNEYNEDSQNILLQYDNVVEHDISFKSKNVCLDKTQNNSNKNNCNEDYMDSQHILLQYDNTIEHNIPFKSENMCLDNILEKSTESIDFDEIKTEINVSSVLNKLIDRDDINENVKDNTDNVIKISQENITDCSTDYNGTQNNEIVCTNHNDCIDLHTDNTKIKSTDHNMNLNHTENDNDDKEKNADKKITNEVLENVDDKEQETDNKKEIDYDKDSIDEWEAKALKKFKGSVLDSIF